MSVMTMSGKSKSREALKMGIALAQLARVRGSSFGLTYSRPSGPIAVTCVMYSPDFAQWKCEV